MNKPELLRIESRAPRPDKQWHDRILSDDRMLIDAIDLNRSSCREHLADINRRRPHRVRIHRNHKRGIILQRQRRNGDFLIGIRKRKHHPALNRQRPRHRPNAAENFGRTVVLNVLPERHVPVILRAIHAAEITMAHFKGQSRLRCTVELQIPEHLAGWILLPAIGKRKRCRDRRHDSRAANRTRRDVRGATAVHQPKHPEVRRERVYIQRPRDRKGVSPKPVFIGLCPGVRLV